MNIVRSNDSWTIRLKMKVVQKRKMVKAKHQEDDDEIDLEDLDKV